MTRTSFTIIFHALQELQGNTKAIELSYIEHCRGINNTCMDSLRNLHNLEKLQESWSYIESDLQTLQTRPIFSKIYSHCSFFVISFTSFKDSIQKPQLLFAIVGHFVENRILLRMCGERFRQQMNSRLENDSQMSLISAEFIENDDFNKICNKEVQWASDT